MCVSLTFCTTGYHPSGGVLYIHLICIDFRNSGSIRCAPFWPLTREVHNKLFMQSVRDGYLNHPDLLQETTWIPLRHDQDSNILVPGPDFSLQEPFLPEAECHNRRNWSNCPSRCRLPGQLGTASQRVKNEVLGGIFQGKRGLYPKGTDLTFPIDNLYERCGQETKTLRGLFTPTRRK